MKEFAKRQNISKKSSVSYVLTLFVVLGCMQGVKIYSELFFNDYYPASYWFEYEKTESEFHAYPAATDQIMMSSFSKWKRDGLDVFGSDSLLCLKGSNWKWIGSQPWEDVKNKKDNTINPEYWALKITLPDFQTVCKVKSSVVVHLQYRNKRQVIESNEFMIVDEEFSN